MKVLAVNSSPRKDEHSKTKQMLTALVEGMREAGAHVDVVDLKSKKVRNCIGCLSCWTKTPGICSIKDDMTSELFPLWIESDLAVYASPLYHFTVNASMKAFIERTLPVLQPFLITFGTETVHPLRHKHPKIALLSVAGFPEHSVFSQLSSWANFIYGRFGMLSAEIYRPLAEALSLPSLESKAREIFDATRQAGREIVENGKISDETMSGITRDIVGDVKLFHDVGNIMWKTCINECMSPAEMWEKGLVPVPGSIADFRKLMLFGFMPQAAGDMKAVIRFDFTGSREGSCSFTIENGGIRASDETADSPDLTIETDFDLWADIMSGKLDGRQMFTEQRYKAQGDLGILMRMHELFGV
ncbi:MAG TPA: NAD(P)H-dependent oxidoreductase [Deltaproteobacteria bacterium]|jgi:putative sterol carrier protein/putative NADPH-quinone reductase|nr:NAD(P)H-dependent oxidoreductase [Deltaproteobacteria bacterium]